jgi:hypothetical protein
MISPRVVFATLLLLVALAPVRSGSAIQFDFSISASPGTVSLSELSQSVAVTIRVSLLSGTPQIVTLNYACLPLDCSLSNPQSGTPPFESVLLISTRPFSALPNSYQVIVQGSAGGNPPLYHNVVISVVVTQPTLTTTQTVSTRTSTGQTVTTTGQVQYTVTFHINPPGNRFGYINVFVAQNWQYVAGISSNGQSVMLDEGKLYTLLAVPVWYRQSPAFTVDYWNLTGGISLVGYVGTRIGRESDISAVSIQVTGNGTASVNFRIKSASSSCDFVYGTNDWFEFGRNATEVGGAVVYLSDITPDEGETITVVGAIVNRLGFPARKVDIYFSYYPSNLVSTTDDHGVFKFSVAIPQGFKQKPQDFTVAGLGGAFEREGAKRPWLLSSGFSGAFIDTQGQRNTLVIYISGFNGSIAGPNQQERSYLQSLVDNGYKVAAPVTWGSGEPSFTLPVGALFKYGFGYRTVLVGWSAGGAEVGHALTEDFAGNFDAGIVLNGPLDGIGLNLLLRAAPVFCSAKFAGIVHTPQLLIWGKGDGGWLTPSVAAKWMEHAQRGMARLDLFDYGHEWLNSSVSVEVQQDIARFLNSLDVGHVTEISGVSILSNSRVSGATYSLADRTLRFSVNGTSGDSGSMNLAIPKNSTDGTPTVSFDGVLIQALIGGDTNYWYVFYTYRQSTHTVTVGRLNLTIPEFQSVGSLVAIACLSLVVAILYPYRRRLDGTCTRETEHEIRSHCLPPTQNS